MAAGTRARCPASNSRFAGTCPRPRGGVSRICEPHHLALALRNGWHPVPGSDPRAVGGCARLERRDVRWASGGIGPRSSGRSPGAGCAAISSGSGGSPAAGWRDQPAIRISSAMRATRWRPIGSNPSGEFAFTRERIRRSNGWITRRHAAWTCTSCGGRSSARTLRIARCPIRNRACRRELRDHQEVETDRGRGASQVDPATCPG